MKSFLTNGYIFGQFCTEDQVQVKLVSKLELHVSKLKYLSFRNI